MILMAWIDSFLETGAQAFVAALSLYGLCGLVLMLVKAIKEFGIWLNNFTRRFFMLEMFKGFIGGLILTLLFNALFLFFVKKVFADWYCFLYLGSYFCFEW